MFLIGGEESQFLQRYSITTVASCQGVRGTIAPPKFWAVVKFLIVGRFSSYNAEFGAENPILGKFGAKIEILSTNNLLCQKFAAVCRKMTTSSVPPTFLTHAAAEYKHSRHIEHLVRVHQSNIICRRLSTPNQLLNVSTNR